MHGYIRTTRLLITQTHFSLPISTKLAGGIRTGGYDICLHSDKCTLAIGYSLRNRLRRIVIRQCVARTGFLPISAIT